MKCSFSLHLATRRPVCLPPQDLNLQAGDNLVVTGWGHLEEKGSFYPFLSLNPHTCSISNSLSSKSSTVSGCFSAGSLSSNLQKAQIPLIDRAQCSDGTVYGSKITLRMICAGYLEGKVDACQVRVPGEDSLLLFSVRLNDMSN